MKQRKQLRDESLKYLREMAQKIEEFEVDQLSKLSKFKELPLTDNTLKGLKENSFISMTDIQKESIIYSLQKKDILALAKTGSGKTLAFLIPLIENLIHEEVSELDGCVGLIITPTRELLVQIYEVLCKIGKYNQFSCGMVIGGKDFKYESERINKINILIGTPGRILQHMDQSVNFELSNLKVLILDEADRILDMGFKKTLDDILVNLPPQRQTLLFSATQTKSIKDLARLSLVNPKYINVSSDETASTPDSLEQSYIVVSLQDKINTLWSFIKTHLNSKILVFFSSSKQVHFVYETFRKLQPGMSLMKLHGRQKQTSRLETTVKFTKLSNVCMFATDIVARGLDFPAIDWVVQLDCPEDSATYIHRVGRSARFGRMGKSLLMLCPSEEELFVKKLTENKISIKKLNVKQNKKKAIGPQLQALCFQNPELKYLAQKLFISYFKSVYIQKDKDVFKVNELPVEEYAKSLGLPGLPNIKLKGLGSENKSKELKNTSRQLLNLQKTDENGDPIESETKVRNKYDKMFERKNQTVLSEHYINMTGGGKDEEEDEEEDFLKVKRSDHVLKEDEIPDLLDVNTSKRSMKKALSKKLSLSSKSLGKKLIFDDDGNTHEIYELQDEKEFNSNNNIEELVSKFQDEENLKMLQIDSQDKEVAKQKKQEKKRRRKELEKQYEEESSEEEEEGDWDIEKDYQSDSDEEVEEPASKKPKWFENDKVNGSSKRDEMEVIEQPEDLEDLEALTTRLMNN